MFTRILRLSAVLWLCTVWHVATARAQFCVPPPSGIVSWWPASGDATDLYGLNNGTLQGGATATTPGEVNTAFQFDGTNGFVQVPNSAALEPTNLTVEAWVRFDSLNSTENSAPGHQYIVFKQNSRSSNFEGYDLGKHRVSGQDLLYFQVASSGGTEIKVDSTNTVSTGVWYHIAGVRGSNYIQLYVNGQLQGQATVSFPQDYGHLPLYFGTTGESYWDGKLAGELDEVSLYNRPLSSNEIYSIYQAGAAGKCSSPPACVTAPPGLVSWWAAEGDAADSVRANNGTLIGGAGFSPGFIGQAFDLNGSNQYVDVPNNPSLNPVNSISVESWVYLRAYAPIASPIVKKAGVSGSPYFGYGLECGNDGNIGFYVFSSNLQTWVGTPGAPLPLNTWTHVVGVYDGTNVSIYVNGILRGSAPLSGAIVPSPNDLQVGHDPSDTSRYFNGLIDEACFYSNTLSASQVQALFAAGHAGKCVPPPVVAFQPIDQTIVAGGTVSFSVVVDGLRPLSYQWQSNGTSIPVLTNPTATNSTFVLSNVQLGQSGSSYSVLVTGRGGTSPGASQRRAF